jgi:RimJ/RimL family protein N-acetyltransferase
MSALSEAAPSSPVIVGSILIGADEMVAAWVSARLPEAGGFEKYKALGVVRGGKIVGGVVYHHYIGHDIRASVAYENNGLASSGVVRALFAYPFLDLKCARISVMVSRKNKKSRKLIEGLGFKLEGVHPKGMDGINDAFSYGMLKEHCRWIKERDNGQNTQTTRAA